jgi:hypothetical protein
MSRCKICGADLISTGHVCSGTVPYDHLGSRPLISQEKVKRKIQTKRCPGCHFFGLIQNSEDTFVARCFLYKQNIYNEKPDFCKAIAVEVIDKEGE